MGKKMNIAFYWHQHQPFYKDADNIYQMPWVRFHGTKDYLDFLEYLGEFPRIKQNINLVPSLLVQIQDYVQNGARDSIWIMTEKNADELSPDDKRFILKNFFMANPTTMIQPYPRYNELYKKYLMEKKYLTEDQIIERFSPQEYRDLQVWYNMTWIGIKSRERAPIAALIKKERDFTEDDKHHLLDEILEILSDIIPKHKKLWEAGQIDLTTTPFYHPILPLICDNHICRESLPDIRLPKLHFAHPEDAEHHVKAALFYFKQVFGKHPDGMWPAEGSVSDDALRIIQKYKVSYVATDEGVLEHSFKGGYNYMDMYEPYIYATDSGSLHMFFRDHSLSDAIGFVYSNHTPENAVEDFMNRLRKIKSGLIERYGEDNLDRHVVSIILDGENCWEYYPNDGKDFISLLFKTLSEDAEFETIRYSEFLEKQGKFSKRLHYIHPGSWINHNFKIWIGSEEDNKSWDLLSQTRNFLVREEQMGVHSEETIKEAWEQIYIAEGSDWNWWYGEEHSSSMDMEFDRLYRSHLIQVYRLLGADIPGELFQTIKEKHFITFEMKHPKNLISPHIDGTWTHFYEWKGAAEYDCTQSQFQSTMHQAKKIVKNIFVGFDLEHIYFRFDFFEKPSMVSEFVANILTPRKITLVFSPLKEIGEAFWWEGEKIIKKVVTKNVRLKDILEVSVPFKKLGLQGGEKIGFQLQTKENGHVLEQFPNVMLIELTLPDETYEEKNWIV